MFFDFFDFLTPPVLGVLNLGDATSDDGRDPQEHVWIEGLAQPCRASDRFRYPATLRWRAGARHRNVAVTYINEKKGKIQNIKKK